MEKRVEKTLRHLQENLKDQAELEELSRQVALSPHHLQRLFKKWTGLSPSQYRQHLTQQNARELLRQGKSVEETTWGVGLSGTGRLHDLMIKLEAITPGQARRMAQGVSFWWGTARGPVGHAFFAGTDRGLNTLRLIPEEGAHAVALTEVQKQWPGAAFFRDDARAARMSEAIFFSKAPHLERLSLWVKGTPFQIQVWRALLAIPPGEIRTYRDLAQAVGRSEAARAVGQAVGKNPVAILIPCHRVIRKDGGIGGYAWGVEKKKALLALEEGPFSPDS
jgi:AraC family transcriptional regulator of adaptative response/methylated-DNA-[protein]-cysteine methyltransferase